MQSENGHQTSEPTDSHRDPCQKQEKHEKGPANSSTPPGGKASKTPAETKKRMLELHDARYGTRRIARSLGCNRKTVQRVLHEAGRSPHPSPRATSADKASKLDPLRKLIEEKVQKDLSVSRILRELRNDHGYTGGRTILAEYVRSIRAPLAPRKKVHRRFETRPGLEIQVDWSPYRVPLGGKIRTVHAFGAMLCHSRKAHVRFYTNERQPTLFEAHIFAFEDFAGVTQRLVYDRVATVVLGQVGRSGKILWHPRFLDFAQHYGYEPFLCRVADPNRKGKDERFFDFLERDFVRGSEFESLEEMNERVNTWLDQVANCRVHGTTGLVPDEVWRSERDFLIALPDSAFPSYREEPREVGPDAVISVEGTPYTVPWRLANRTVRVRLYSDHFEVQGSGGEVVFARKFVVEANKGKLQIDPSHYEGLKRSPHAGAGATRRMEDSLLERFPTLADLLAGLRLRMKSLVHVHLRALLRLAALYGDQAFLSAASRAQSHRAFNAQVVRRILEQQCPIPPEEPVLPLGADARARFLLGDVDSGSLDDYAHLDDDDDDQGEAGTALLQGPKGPRGGI